MSHAFCRIALFSAALIVASAPRASAQGDEIQVYDGGLAPKGVF